MKLDLKDIKEEIIERAAEKLAERLFDEIKKNDGNVPYIPQRPFYPTVDQPVMYGCPTSFSPLTTTDFSQFFGNKDNEENKQGD